MRHFCLDTYHGPVLLTQRESDWVLASAQGSCEVYPGSIPFWCLARARPISAAEAEVLTCGDADTDDGWAATFAPAGRESQRPGAGTSVRLSSGPANGLARQGPSSGFPS